MDGLEIIYILGALGLGFLFGVIVELLIEARQIADLQEGYHKLELENEMLRRSQPSEVIEITDRSVDAENIPEFTQNW